MLQLEFQKQLVSFSFAQIKTLQGFEMWRTKSLEWRVFQNDNLINYTLNFLIEVINGFAIAKLCKTSK